MYKTLKVSILVLWVASLCVFPSAGSIGAVQARAFQLPSLVPSLSADGLTLYNAVPPHVMLVDHDPAMQGIKIPTAPALQRALADSAAATATFTITYIAAGGSDPWEQACIAFPENAKTAFNAAAAIWANTIRSSVPITIQACWANLGDGSTLGYSGAQPISHDFTGAPQAGTWYQGALANALHGSDLDPANFDMNITYNSEFTWYYGTDSNPTAGTYDLVTVAAHEMGHGLNFSGSAVYSGGVGSYGYDPIYPDIYDRFMEDNGGTKLVTYTNPSPALGALLTSNSLWFDGANADAANGGSRVKMYAPATWEDGSSYGHLDYLTFRNTPNSMMVYAIGAASANHNPGAVTTGLLKDLGWGLSSDPVPPPAPTGVSATDGIYTDKVQISWNASSGATSYQVHRNTTNSSSGASQLGTPAASPYNDTSAVAGTTYYYFVKACNSAGCSGFSSSDSGYRAVPPPPIPTGVSATDGSFTDKVRVSWNASSGATYYQVWRSFNSYSNYAELLGSSSASPYDDTTLAPDYTNWYFVKACSAAGCSDFSSPDDGYRETPPPSIPTGVSATDGTFTDRVQVNWNDAGDAGYFEVYRNTSNSSTGASLLDAPGIPPFDDTSAVAGTTYWYFVKACQIAHCSGFSASDPGYRGLSIPSAPSGVNATDGSYTDKVQVSWTAAGGASSYQVYRNTANSSGSAELLGSPSTSPYADTSALPGSLYWYFVKACNGGGCSGFSLSNDGYRGLIPPTMVSASDGTFADKVQVSWYAAPSLFWHQVYRNNTNASSGAALLGSSYANTYDDTSAAPGTTYWYFVKVCGDAGCSDFSTSDSGYRAAAAPSAPSGVSATDGTYADKVQVSWNASNGATSYLVYRNSSNSSSGASVVGSPGASPYDDTTAIAGTTYYYWVKACSGAGCSDFSSSDSGYLAAVPSVPTGVSATDGTYADKVRVSWNASSGATYYEVSRGISNNSSGASVIGTPAASPYDDTLAAGNVYWYFVRACNGDVCSDYSSPDSGYRAAPPPSIPTDVSATDGTFAGMVLVSWSDAGGASSYQVYRNTTNSSSGASLVGSPSASPFDDTSAVPGSTYWYFVKACNAGGCSDFSSSDSGYRAIPFKFYLPLLMR